MTRTKLALLAMLVAGGCTGGDVTAPSTSDISPVADPRMNRSPSGSRVIEVEFEKWITTAPSMAGNADGVLGAFTGTVLQRIVSADGSIVHLRAEYVITNEHRKGHSFTAVIEGDQNLITKTAVLTGVVTEGWKKGAPVLVNFNVLSPCTVPTAPVGVAACFKGTIRIARGGHGDAEGRR